MSSLEYSQEMESYRAKILEVVAAWEEAKRSQDALVTSSEKATKQGLQEVNAYERQIAAGLKLAESFTTLDGAVVAYTSRLIDNRQALNQYSASAERAISADEALALAARKYNEELTARIAGTRASIQEETRYKDAVAGLEKIIVQHQISLADVNRVWGDISKGNIVTYNSALDGVRKQIERIIVAYGLLGEADRKRALEAERTAAADIAAKQKELDITNQLLASQREAAATRAFVSQGVATASGVTTPGATVPQIASYKQALAALEEFQVKNRIAAAEVNRIWTELNAGQIKNYSGALSGVQQKLIAVQKAQAGLGRELKNSASSAREFNLSLLSIQRMLTSAFIYRSFYNITSAIREGVAEAIKLQKAIAEIQTISQQNQLPFDEWLQGIKAVSNAWGVDLNDTASAVYQTLSNQIAVGQQAIEFVNTAAKFAITTQTTTKDAVDLLTAAINAFELSASDAEYVAANLFKTIELGRVRAEEMAQSFGQIAPLANALGIGLEELDATIASVTINGLKYNQAATQIRGIMTKLIKPTEEMSAFFREIGVNSGEAAIQTYGLAGLLELMAKRADGSSTELAKLFNNIRGLTGATLLTGSSLQTYVDDLQKAQNAEADYAKAVELVMQSAGKKLEVEITKIRNIFRTEFGNYIVEILGSATQYAGALEVAIKVVANSITALLIPATVLLGRALYSLALSNPYTAIAVAIYEIITLLRTLSKSTEEVAKKAADDWSESYKARAKSESDAIANSLRTFERAVDIQNREVLKQSATVIAEWNKIIDAQDAAFKTLQERVGTNSKEIVKSIEEQARQAEKLYSQYTRDAEAAVTDVKDLFREASRTIFDWNIEELDIEGKVKAIDTRIAQLRKERLIVASTNDTDAVKAISDEIRNLFKQRQQLTRQAGQEDERATEKAKKLQLDSSDEVMDYQRRRNRLEVELRNETAKRKPEQDKILKLQRQISDLDQKHLEKMNEIRLQMQQITYNNVQRIDYEKQYIGLIVEEAAIRQALSQQAAKNAEVARKEQLQATLLGEDLKRAYADFKGYDLEKLLALDDPTKLTNEYKKLSSTFDELIMLQSRAGVEQTKNADLQTQKQQLAIAYEKRLSQIQAERAQKEITDNRKIVEDRIKAIRDQLAADQQQVEKTGAILAGIRGLLVSRGTDIEARDILASGAAPSVEREAQQYLATLAKVDSTLQAISANRSIPVDALANIVTELRKIDQLSNYNLLPEGIDEELGKFADVLDKDAQRTRNSVTAQNELVTGRAALETLTKQYSEAVQFSTKTLEEAKAPVDAYKKSIEDLTGALQGLAAAQNQIKAITLGTGTVDEFATGGPAGSDYISAKLNPGEFVVNAAATKKYFTQLVAMNSGRRYAAGGPVSNVNTGDFNITVQSSGNEAVDAVKIGKALRRSIRQGRFKF